MAMIIPTSMSTKQTISMIARLPLLLLFAASLLFMTPPPRAEGSTVRYFEWKVEYADVTRLCNTKRILTVNGMFPGPTVYVTEGDSLVVSVTNLAQDNITIHWHGVRQQLTCWSDGVAFITQCPIKPGQTFTYRFNVADQRGTLLWHAHKSWLRATVHGAFIIQPKWPQSLPGGTSSSSAPFQGPKELPPLILGEWWIDDVEEEVVQGAMRSGGNHIPSNALTINGEPGALYNCSDQGVTRYEVQRGVEYLVRVINAAVNVQLFLGIANHTLTVVEADGQETEPLDAAIVVIAPGQTLGLLLRGPDAEADAARGTGTDFLIAASAFSENGDFPATPTTAVLRYIIGSSATTPPPPPSSLVPPASSCSSPLLLLPLPPFPPHNDSTFVFRFFRDSLCRQRIFPSNTVSGVPLQPDYRLLYTFGYGVLPCPPHVPVCFGPFASRFATAINNISFTPPTTISILEAYYQRIKGVYEEGFPDLPPAVYNFTGKSTIGNPATNLATMVRVLPFNSSVEVVLQNTRTLFQESHPVHLHGHNFWVVAYGLGNFDASTDYQAFNLRNPISRNTVVVPAGGWTAIRFRTLNPGVWFLHCHLDVHQMWGMSMAFIVLNGQTPDQILPPPPFGMPTCP